jgi:hypothetical protein
MLNGSIISSPNIQDGSLFSPILPTQPNSPDNTVPMVSLNDRNKVLYIDPKLASDKLKELSNNTSTGLFSPTYARSPMTVKPPIGSMLQSPSDSTPTRISKTYGSNLAYARSPAITKSINDFLHTLPPAVPEKKIAAAPEPISLDEKINDAKKKADYRVKRSILREAYPQMNIPEPGENESIEEIEVAYREYVKRIHVESSVETNKVYLLILWLIIDVVGTRFFRLPFKGRYVKSQFKYMQQYQMLLIKLGERSYIENEADGWSPEFRLLAMAVFHAVIFALVQLLASKLGGDSTFNDKMADDLREVIDNFLTQNKVADVLRRAEQAGIDNPVPLSATQNSGPPLGEWGNVLGNFMPMLMNMFNGGGGEQAAEQPQIKRPTTFGSRHRRSKVTEEI